MTWTAPQTVSTGRDRIIRYSGGGTVVKTVTGLYVAFGARRGFVAPVLGRFYEKEAAMAAVEAAGRGKR